MAARYFRHTAATVAAVLCLTGAAFADSTQAVDGPLQLQPEFPTDAPFTAIADDVLPDAPDLGAIPFFAASDAAVYFRVDAGFGALSANGAVTANGRFNPTLSGPAIFGAGVGYRFNGLLRADITAEYRSRARIGTGDGIRAHIDGANVLASIYADIGTWHGVTPYVGASVGMGWNRLSHPHAFGGDRVRAGFVWALGGGFAVEIAPAVTVDIGYRYLHTGTHRAPDIAVKESGSHDLRIGLRWRLGDTARAAALP